MVNIDFSGFEATAPLGSCASELMAAPSFQIPDTIDVSVDN